MNIINGNWWQDFKRESLKDLTNGAQAWAIIYKMWDKLVVKFAQTCGILLGIWLISKIIGGLKCIF